MELKIYQQNVINDLETFLKCLARLKKTDEAFNWYWEDRLGPYNPAAGSGMQPYKNTIPNAANVCIKVPTAGGKTFIACNALRSIFNYLPDSTRFVVWLVPWSNLLDQTVAALKDPAHPYRQKLNSLFNYRVELYEKNDLLQGVNFNPSIVREQLSIVVMSFASLRAKNKEGRKVYQQNERLDSFKPQFTTGSHLLDEMDETSLINVIRSMQPVVVVDESHNAESVLSVEMLQILNPSFVLDLTATPKRNSNIISLVPAIELKKECMVKLPVIVYNHHDRTDVINSALHLQRKLELLAINQEAKGGKYIRPIVLFQAQPKTGNENITYAKIKKELLNIGIPERQVKIKTATIDELKGEDLLSRDCEVRYIITINALKEGWDCPFAYVLASLADKSSVVDVEQILGRVLRQPYVMNHGASLLNISYVLTASAKFNVTLQSIVKGLQASGFSDRDYREVDGTLKDTQHGLELASPESEGDPEIELDQTRVSFRIADSQDSADANPVISKITAIAQQEIATSQQALDKRQTTPYSTSALIEIGNKAIRYKLVKSQKQFIENILLPKFYIIFERSNLFFNGPVLLSQEPLLKNFRLIEEDVKIDLDHMSSKLFSVDIEKTDEDNYDSRFKKLSDKPFKDTLERFLFAKPRDIQIKSIASQLLAISNINPIDDRDIKAYVERILNSLNTEQLRDVWERKHEYATQIKDKIRQHADKHAEQTFKEWIKLGKIQAIASWKFPDMIIPVRIGPAIGKSLYEREGAVNNFEISIITDIASLPNINFWHRNLGRGNGFSINGFKSNHYPDFIVGTNAGKVILIETKGDDRDNSDSQAKCRLGNAWAQLAGEGFNYFMIFDAITVEGAYNRNKAIDLIRQL